MGLAPNRTASRDVARPVPTQDLQRYNSNSATPIRTASRGKFRVGQSPNL